MEILFQLAAVKILLACTGIAITGYIFYRVYQEIIAVGLLREKIDQSKSWVKIPGRVIALGVGVDHNFPYFVPDVSHIERQDDLNDFIKRYERVFTLRNENMNKYNGILIKYTYSYNDDNFTSRSIGVLPDDADIDRVHRYKYGSNIAVMINPDNPKESIVRPTSDELYGKYVVATLTAHWKYLGILVLMWGIISTSFI